MEGFDADALDALLNLRARGLRSVAIMPLGYRDAANDWLVSLKRCAARARSSSPGWSERLVKMGAVRGHCAFGAQNPVVP